MPINLPYFDDIFARSPDSPLVRAFQRHVHWGYYSSPEPADASDAAFVVAAEEMSRQVCLAARVRDGFRVLDCGCGFGGTIAHLNEQRSGCELVGLNIDARQLVRARERVKAGRGNNVRFVEGDACALPFDGGAFDSVLAVECIFHFPSRQTFFREAHRVLRPGGTLMVSDFVLDDDRLDDLAAWLSHNSPTQAPFFGASSATTSSGYAALASSEGFQMLVNTDITAETIPTYAWARRLYRDAGSEDGEKTVAFIEEQTRLGFVQYRILSFEAKSFPG